MKDKKYCGTCKFWKLDCNSYPCIKCFNDQNHKHFVPKEEDDSVSHPNHYQSKSGLEAIDVVRAFTEDLTGVESYYTGNILKYMCRWKKKNGLEDLKKARQYLDWLIEAEDPHMSEKDIKRELNRIYGASKNEEKKEPPKNGRYSMSEEDCFVPQTIQPIMVSTYKFADSPIEKQAAVEIIWNQFCDAFLKALTEVSDEKKENEKNEK